MFTTLEEAQLLTNKNVTEALIYRAQSVIEIFVGKFESEVTKENDLELLKRAVAYQAAYMNDNEDIVFEQIAASTISQNESATTFKQGDQISPWIAPLAAMACKKLSFIRSKSIKTGKVAPYPTINYDDSYYQWVVN